MRLNWYDGLAALLIAVGSGLALIFGGTDWQGPAGVCLISMAFALAMARRRLPRVKSEGVPDFLTVFLTFQIFNKLLTVVSLAAGERHLAAYEASQLVEARFKFAAEWVHLAAMIFFSAGWLLVERLLRDRVRREGRTHSVQFLLGFYLVTTVLALALQRASFRLEFGLLSTIMQYSSLAAVGVLLASKTGWGVGGAKAILSVLLLVPATYLALTTGTKGALVVVALPLFMAALAKGVRRTLLVLIPFAMFMLIVGIPLSEEIRKANWESYGVREGIGIDEGWERVLSRYQAEGPVTVLERTAVRFAHRASSAQSGGVVMQVAEEDGLIGLEPIKLLPAIFIPRFLWPDKPMFQPGAWFAWYLGQAASPEDATSATATMLGTETYWMLGVPGLVLLAALGAMYAMIWQTLAALSARAVMGIAGMYAMLGAAVRFEESHVIYAISSPIITLVYVWALVAAERLGRDIMVAKAGHR